jgi:phosphoglucosamine mutase
MAGKQRMIAFGTDGIRGAANMELTTETTMLVGKCVAARMCSGRGAMKRVLIGKDTRVSGDMLEAALMAGICSAGADAWRIGVAPTPTLAFLTKTLNCDCGIMISASHNPVEDNGLKVFSSQGLKLDEDTEKDIEKLMAAKGKDIPLPTGDNVGNILDKAAQVNMYLAHVRHMLRGAYLDKPIVADCANGAASRLAKKIFKERAPEVIFIHSDEDGHKINVECGSTRPQQLQKKVLESGAALGFAFDGDADRCIFVNELGQVVDGDQIMLLCARAMKRQNQLKDNTLVSTVMSNMGLERTLAAEGIAMLRTPVGDKYVLREMLAHDYDLGGEQSGHIIFRRLATTGDGLITAAQVLKIVSDSGRPFSELTALERSAQFLKNVRVPDKEAFFENKAIAAKVKAVEKKLGQNGRVLVRPSGTEPKVRVMVETWDESLAEKLTDEIIATVRAELGAE